MTKHILYIKTSNSPWEIISSNMVDMIFEGCRLETLFYMPMGYAYEPDINQVNKVIDVGSQIDQLLAIIQKSRPDIIYLQTNPHTKTENIFSILRDTFPTVRIWVEMYDCSVFFSTDFLLNHNYAELEIATARDSVEEIMKKAEVVIHKNGGDIWKFFEEEHENENYFRWHPVVNQREYNRTPIKPLVSTCDTKSNVPRDLLICGSIPANISLDDKGELSENQILLRLIRSIGIYKKQNLKIFNPANRVSNDERFQRLKFFLLSFGDNISYSPFVASSELASQVIQCEMGIFCMPNSVHNDEKIGKMGVPNRVATFIAAQKPVLVDDVHKNIAEIISEFNAGTVIKHRDVDNIADIIESLDLDAMTNGARKLRKHWLAHNAKVLQVLKAKLH